ncbi:hypothetical protein EKD04_015595 [Chloroflexales bacterium ZM16-3]|nr:hypothetical protein [Chloroflexales bacterium ZM16-3]
MDQPHQQQQWMRHWLHAALALAEVRQQELAQMSDVAALAAVERVLTPGVARDPLRTHASSGLVEQQRLFQRSRQ